MAGRGLFERLESEGWNGVADLIAERSPETLFLEFKCKAFNGTPGKLHDDDKKNLAKAISAFANTEGGCLIFGVSTDRGTGGDPDRAKAPQPIADLGKFKRSVEAVLRDVVTPAVPSIELHAVEEVQGSDSGIVAIYVPQSIARPHRANMGPGDVREHYYQRSASRSDIMPHSILAALMGRLPSARLYVLFHLWLEQPNHLRFLIRLGNAGRGSARQPAIKLFEVEKANLSLWTEAFSGTQISADWQKKQSSAFGEEGALLLLASRDTIVYPGDRVVLTENGPGSIPGGWRWGGRVDLPFKGVIYAADAAPVEFDQRIVADAVTDRRLSFVCPSDTT